jgi:NADH-quinone oxidoreductase subunit L
MWIPLALLAVLSVVGGYVGVAPALSSWVGIHSENKFEHFLEPAIAKVGGHAPAAAESHGAAAAPAAAPADAGHEGGHDVGMERTFTVISSIAAILGLLFGFWFFNRKPLWQPPRLLEDKYKVDEIYDGVIVSPIEQTSRHVLWQIVDVKIIDGFVNGTARLFAALAGVLRYSQTGYARNYAAVILAGAIIVIGYFGYVALR